jgi:hypothetical protein
MQWLGGAPQAAQLLLAICDLTGARLENRDENLATLNLPRVCPSYQPIRATITTRVALESDGFDETADQVNIAVEHAALCGV